MLTILLYCITVVWTPASGPVSTYSLFLDGTVNQTGILETQAALCFRDQLPHRITVQAFDAAGNPGPMSDESEPIKMMIASPLRTGPLSPTMRADFDDNGVVGFSDFTVFSNSFGKRVEE